MKKPLSFLLSAAVVFSMGCSSGEKTENADVAKTGPTEMEQAEGETEVSLPTGPIDKDLERITLPEGFRIDYYAKDVDNARSMVLSESGILFVGTREEDKVYAVVDENKDGKADLLAGSDGENDFNGNVTVLKGSASGITTSGATTYGPSAFGISTTTPPSSREA